MSQALQQTLNDLHKGVSAVSPERLVMNKAGQVLDVINFAWSETRRADAAEAKLAAIALEPTELDSDN